MKTFTAILTHTEYSRAEVKINARNQAEADQLASEIYADQVDDWNPFDGSVDVESVSEVRVQKSKNRRAKKARSQGVKN
jgi:hypothetical protein